MINAEIDESASTRRRLADSQTGVTVTITTESESDQSTVESALDGVDTDIESETETTVSDSTTSTGHFFLHFRLRDILCGLDRYWLGDVWDGSRGFFLCLYTLITSCCLYGYCCFYDGPLLRYIHCVFCFFFVKY